VAKPAALAALAALPDLEPSQIELPPNPLETPHDIQAAAEGVPVGDTVEFMGEKYRISDRIGLAPLIKFAMSATSGATTDDLDGLAAIGQMLNDCLDPAEHDRFWADATAKKAEGDDLLPVVTQTIELLNARPTRRPSDSSAGPATTSASLTGSSPLPDSINGSELVSVDTLLRRAEAG
jgi:hypothetical protein